MSFESLKSGKRIVVIGGVAAGLSAASKARKLRSDIEIVVFEKSGHISYGACGLPYLISDLIKSPGELVSHDSAIPVMVVNACSRKVTNSHFS